MSPVNRNFIIIFATVIALLLCPAHLVFATEAVKGTKEEAVESTSEEETAAERAGDENAKSTEGTDAESKGDEGVKPAEGTAAESAGDENAKSTEGTDAESAGDENAKSTEGTAAESKEMETEESVEETAVLDTEPALSEDALKADGMLSFTGAGRSIADTASTWEELREWLNNHKHKAGELRLTSDITVPEEALFEVSLSKKILLDFDKYTLTVQGVFSFYATNLTIMGDGTCLIRVSEGGRLTLDPFGGALSLLAADGYAFIQEEGGVLYEDGCTVEGKTAYAKEPVVVEICEKKNPLWSRTYERFCVIVKPDEEFKDSSLPGYVEAQINFQGKLTKDNIPIVWEPDQCREELYSRRRTTVTGSFLGYRSIAPAPGCLVVFRDGDIVFTHAVAKIQTHAVIIDLSMTLPSAERMVSLEYSFDGKEWESCKETLLGPDQFGALQLLLSRGDWDNGNNGFLPWGPNEPPIYLRLRWQESDRQGYSDVLYFDKDSYEEGKDIGGTRGGGTDIAVTSPMPEPSPEPEETSDTGKESEEKQAPLMSTEAALWPKLPLEPEPFAPEPAEPESTDTSEMLPDSGHSSTHPSSSGTPVNPDGDITAPEVETAEELYGQSPSAVWDSRQEETAVEALAPVKNGKPKRDKSRMVSAVAGCAATTALLGAAGIYHSAAAQKWLLTVIRQLMQIKK